MNPVPFLHVSPATPGLSAARSELSLVPLEISLPMHEQMFAPVQNAASDRPVYPDHPAQALIGSIEQRRSALVEDQKDSDKSTRGISPKLPTMSAHEPEVHR